MGCLSSMLAYADTGTGKTALAGAWARWVNSVTGKRVRLYTAEPGGLGTIGDVIDAGIIDVWDISTRPNHFETIEFASKGAWPSSDETTLELPTEDTWKDIGGCIFEGATAFGELLLYELQAKGANNEIIGAEKAPQQFTSGKLRIAGNNQTHYGIVQSRVRRAINESQRMPAHVLWTARELKVKDEDDPKKQYVFGPLLAGSAATLNMPAWFGSTVHLTTRKLTTYDPQTKRNLERVVRRMYTTRHFDDGSDIPYLAQLRLPPSMTPEMPEFFDLDKDGEAVISFLNKLAELRERAKQKILGK